MKEMYRREKRRIRFERWSWITITWILYLIKLQGQVPSFYSQHYEERANMICKHIDFFRILSSVICKRYSLFYTRAGKESLFVRKICNCTDA